MVKGSYAELHELLVLNGYSYEKTVGKNKHYKHRTSKKTRVLKFVRPGRKAKRVKIRISDRLTQTRRHGTPDVYTVKKP